MNNNFDQSISAVIPTYNQKELLLRALKSVHEQSTQCNEIIVIDDNSDFNVQDYLTKKGIQDITIIRNKDNLGPSGSRNVGAKKATSKYISFLDSDDYWHKEKNTVMLTLFEKSNISLAYASQYGIDELGNINEIIDKKYSGNVLKQLSNGWIPPNPSSLMIDRCDYLELGGMDSSLWSCEDVDFWIRLSINKKKVSYSNQCLSYFSNDSSIRLSYNVQKRISGTKIFLKKWSSSKDNNKFVMKFSKNYWVSVIFPIVIKEFQYLRLLSGIRLFLIYLFFNKFFYIRAIKKIFK